MHRDYRHASCLLLLLHNILFVFAKFCSTKDDEPGQSRLQCQAKADPTEAPCHAAGCMPETSWWKCSFPSSHSRARLPQAAMHLDACCAGARGERLAAAPGMPERLAAAAAALLEEGAPGARAHGRRLVVRLARLAGEREARARRRARPHCMSELGLGQGGTACPVRVPARGAPRLHLLFACAWLCACAVRVLCGSAVARTARASPAGRL